MTGTTPHSGKRLRSAGLDELIRIIRDEEPPAPSKRISSSETVEHIAESRRLHPARIGTLMRGELDWIVMKALEKDRSRRYQSCGELADDIRRYLNQEQVLACPPTFNYRVTKFIRRNAVGVSATAAVIVALMMGLVTTSWQWWRTQLLYQDRSEAYTKLVSIGRNINRNEAAFHTLFDSKERLNEQLIQSFDDILLALDRASESKNPSIRRLEDQCATAVLNYWDVAIGQSRFKGNDGPETNYFRLHRALVLARWGRHEQAVSELLGFAPRNEEDPTPEYQLDMLIRIYGLCARAASDQPPLSKAYAQQGFLLLKQRIVQANEELQRIARTNAYGIKGSNSSLVVEAMHRLLDNPDVQPLQSRMSELAEMLTQFSTSSELIDADSIEPPKENAFSISGFPNNYGDNQ